jgi:hypothetical protein
MFTIEDRSPDPARVLLRGRGTDRGFDHYVLVGVDKSSVLVRAQMRGVSLESDQATEIAAQMLSGFVRAAREAAGEEEAVAFCGGVLCRALELVGIEAHVRVEGGSR